MKQIIRMKRSKLVFLILSIVFLIVLILVIIDFSRKTTFPGKKEGNFEHTGSIVN